MDCRWAVLFAALLSSALLPVWGWQSVFYIGGALPCLLSLLLIALLPESVQFLSQRVENSRKISKLLAPIAPEIATESDRISFAAPEAARKGLPVKYLFTDGRAVGTVLLWIPNFMNLLLMYVILNWLPALLRASGMSVSDGVTATSFFSLGGILGTLGEGFLMKFLGPYRILLAEFGLCSLLTASLAMTANSCTIVIILTFLLGFLVIGAQAGLNVLAAQTSTRPPFDPPESDGCWASEGSGLSSVRFSQECSCPCNGSHGRFCLPVRSLPCLLWAPFYQAAGRLAREVPTSKNKEPLWKHTPEQTPF